MYGVRPFDYEKDYLVLQPPSDTVLDSCLTNFKDSGAGTHISSYPHAGVFILRSEYDQHFGDGFWGRFVEDST